MEILRFFFGHALGGVKTARFRPRAEDLFLRSLYLSTFGPKSNHQANADKLRKAIEMAGKR